MTKYTAEDFANARFAEHEEGAFAARIEGDAWPWADSNLRSHTDAEMAHAGWVPVPTKPTITKSQRAKVHAAWGIPESGAWLRGFYYAGGRVIPDPEPTNTEKLESLLSTYTGFGLDSTFGKLAEYLNDNGVTAPKED